MSRAANKFAALVRGDDGALHVRRFATAADAAGVAAREREFVPAYPIHPEDVKPTTKGWPPSRLARELGISSRTICRRCERDQLPYINHGGRHGLTASSRFTSSNSSSSTGWHPWHGCGRRGKSESIF